MFPFVAVYLKNVIVLCMKEFRESSFSEGCSVTSWIPLASYALADSVEISEPVKINFLT